MKAYPKLSELSILVKRGQKVEMVDTLARENHWNVRLTECEYEGETVEHD